MASGSERSGSTARGWLIGGIACFVLAAAVMGYWFAQGGHFVTQYQVAVTEVQEDEFGDEIESTVMKDRFQFGLMPDKGYDGAAPIAGAMAAVGAALFFVSWRRRRGGDDGQG